MMDPNNFMQATIWLSGSIWGASWEYVVAILPWILLLVPWAVYKSQHLNVLNLGDHTAAWGYGGARAKNAPVHLRRPGRRLRGRGGGIAFLGLVARIWRVSWWAPSSGHRLSALLGSLVLLVADMIGKNLMAPSEIPVGLVVSASSALLYLFADQGLS